MATDKNGWGAGKCPSCKSYNTDSNPGGDSETGLDTYDCMDCGHGWSQQPRKNAKASGPVNKRAALNASRAPVKKWAEHTPAEKRQKLDAFGVGLYNDIFNDRRS